MTKVPYQTLQTMKSKIFKFAVISDIHLGSRRNTAEEIITNLNREFDDNPYFAELDLLILAGDIFDTFLSSIDILPIAVWESRLIRLCKKHDVVLRILKGTPSHDGEQCISFEYVNEKITDLNADVKYIKDLSIWYEEKFDMNFLFVPDEWSVTSEKTLSEVRELLKDRGLEKVDYAIMHGNFEYQLPSFVKAPKHDSQAYLAIVKHLIFIGHVHTYSNFERIYAQGSFDRLSHGQEEPKGYLRVYRHEDDFHEVQFIENKAAKKFITIDCKDEGLSKTLSLIESKVENLPEGSYVRVKANESNPILTSLDELLKKYPRFIWSKDTIAPEQDKGEEIEEQELFTPIEITRENISQLLSDRILNKKIESSIYDRTQYYIKEMLGK